MALKEYSGGISPAEHETVGRLRRALFGWGRRSGRDFWWRHQQDPYVTTVVEILLKQTRASSVVDEIRRFIDRYPTPAHLSRARLSRLETDLRPFGFHRQRAQHLKALGRALTVGGRSITADREALLALPGVGPYAASAVRVFAFGRREPVIDVNVVRIVQRIFGVKVERGEGRRNQRIKDLAVALLDGREPRRLNWALLDFGAQVCRARNPKCGECPLAEVCSTRGAGLAVASA